MRETVASDLNAALSMTLHTRTALELRSLLDKREVSSVEIVESLYARADAVDAKINAYTEQLRRDALIDAKRCDEERARGDVRGALHGLPISVKESIEVRGTETTAGLRARAGRRVEKDAVTVQLLREQGAIILGKTNIPQTLLSSETTNAIYGTTNNPWNHARTPGGSSGGESALIASGQSPWGIGTDVGGSIRIPAGHTGICGMKPTVHRWSNMGSTGAFPGQEFIRSQMGPLARTTSDLAFLLRSLDTPLHARFDPEVAPLPIGDPAAVATKKIRVGVFESDGYVEPSAAVKRAVREAAAHLEHAGVEVVPYTPPNAENGYLFFIGAMSSDGLHTLERELGGEEILSLLKVMRFVVHLPGKVRTALVRALHALGEDRVARSFEMLREKRVHELWSLNWKRLQMIREESATWTAQGIDAVICPVYATPAPQHGATSEFAPGGVYTMRYNVMNLPAGVVPVTRVKDEETSRNKPKDRIDKRAAFIDKDSGGMPVGVQVVARPFREDVALALMQLIETGARSNDLFPHTPID